MKLTVIASAKERQQYESDTKWWSRIMASEGYYVASNPRASAKDIAEYWNVRHLKGTRIEEYEAKYGKSPRGNSPRHEENVGELSRSRASRHVGDSEGSLPRGMSSRPLEVGVVDNVYRPAGITPSFWSAAHGHGFSALAALDDEEPEPEPKANTPQPSQAQQSPTPVQANKPAQPLPASSGSSLGSTTFAVRDRHGEQSNRGRGGVEPAQYEERPVHEPSAWQMDTSSRLERLEREVEELRRAVGQPQQPPTSLTRSAYTDGKGGGEVEDVDFDLENLTPENFNFG